MAAARLPLSEDLTIPEIESRPLPQTGADGQKLWLVFAGLMLALRTTFTPFSGVERLLISFEVVVMGGLGSFWGAMLAGIALGVAQLVGLRLNPNSGFLYANLVFFAFVMLRPNGLFGARQ